MTQDTQKRVAGARPELAAPYGELKRIHAAAALLNSAAAFFASESVHGMRGAVKWVEGADGALVIFTRGEYREQLLRAVDGPDDPTHRFSPAEKPELSDEAIKEAALAAGAAKFYPDAQSKKPWGEEAFLVTGGFLQRFAKAICSAPVPEDLQDDEGENQAVRMFLLLYGQPGLTVARMRNHMAAAGWPQSPEWATKPEAQGHLTKAGAQSWLRHLFALETSSVVIPALSAADEAKLLEAIKKSPPMPILQMPGPDEATIREAKERVREACAQACEAPWVDGRPIPSSHEMARIIRALELP